MSNQSKIIGAIVVVLLVLMALASFFAIKSVNTSVQKPALNMAGRNSANVVSSEDNGVVTPQKEKALMGSIDMSNPDAITEQKMERLMTKSNRITFEEILDIVPAEEKAELASATQEQKDSIVNSWNDMKDTGGDPTKIR
jgi:hypothetical protein